MNRPFVVAALIFPVIVIFAQNFVSVRLKEADYSYVIVDDYGHGKRDSFGFLGPNPEAGQRSILSQSSHLMMVQVIKK